MSKMSKEEFTQRYVLDRGITNNDLNDLGYAITMAGKIWEAIKEEYKVAPCKSENELTGEPLKWFNAVWDAWNTGIATGTKGGIRDAIEAFKKSSIKDRAAAVVALKSAKHHALKIRKELEAKGSTPPHFNKWFNSGAWDTRTENVNIEGVVVIKEDPAIVKLKDDIKEMSQSIKQFTKMGQKQLIQPAQDRKDVLEKQLKQLEK